MRRSRTVSVFVALAAVVTMLSAGAAGAAPADRATEVAAHWTADRIANATPRDLVIDHRGLGYLRGASGDLQPYGHNVAAERSQLRAVPVPMKPPSGGGGGGGSDTIAPSVSVLDPTAGATIGASHTFSAEVTDDVGVRSVTFEVRTSGSNTSQSFSASPSGNTWSVTLEGFTDGDWEWRVIAKDTARKGGNTTTTSWIGFSVDTGGTPPPPPPPGGGDVTDADWIGVGDVTQAVGRIYFEMPSNRRLNRWNGYVCSGTAVTDSTAGRSVIITAAHCVYDDANKAFARNVLFIPQQQNTSGSGTDTNCSNDPIGCWTPAFGVVDADWTTRTFPDNIPWDFAYYVVPDSGAHIPGFSSSSASLDGSVTELDVAFNQFTLGGAADAIGYSYSQDPRLRYCSEALTTESSYGDLWLGSCDLSGGSSGGPWLQPAGTGNGPIISVNSWGYTTSPGMAGPKLNSQASCLFGIAKNEAFFTAADGREGISPNC
jgi:hypothetical protein